MTGSSATSTDSSDERVYFRLLEKAGSMGRYQKITVAFWCALSYICGGLMFIVPYLLYQDPYVCQDKPEGACHKFVCELTPEERQCYIPPPSMYTLGNKFGDYRCDTERLQLDSVASMMYLGTVIGFLAITLLGGLTGRRNIMLISICSALLGMLLVVFCANLAMAGAGLLIAVIGVQNGFTTCFYFLSETVAESHRQKYSVMIQLFYGVGVLANVGFFYLVGNWQIIIGVFYIIPAALILIGVVVIVRDTPFFLVTKCKAEESFRAFKHIAKLNKIEKLEITLDELDSVRSSHEESGGHDAQGKKKGAKIFTVIDLFRYTSLRKTTLLLAILHMVIIFVFYAPALMLDEFHLSIFIDGLVVGVSEIIAYPICYLIITRFKRKIVAYACFASVFACSFVLIFLWKGSNDDSSDIWANIGVLIFIFIFRFSVTVEYTFFYVYFNELYPTQVRVLGTGLVSLVGGLSVTAAPVLIDFWNSINFPVMVMFSILALVCIACSYFLPQTYQCPPADVIEELRVSHSHKESLIEGSERDFTVNPQSEGSLGSPLIYKKNDGKSTEYSEFSNDD